MDVPFEHEERALATGVPFTDGAPGECVVRSPHECLQARLVLADEDDQRSPATLPVDRLAPP